MMGTIFENVAFVMKVFALMASNAKYFNVFLINYDTNSGMLTSLVVEGGTFSVLGGS
jgi:hypothetical protein